MTPEEHPTQTVRIASSKNRELEMWIEYLKWKSERAHKRQMYGASMVVAGVAILSVVGPVTAYVNSEIITDPEMRVFVQVFFPALASGVVFGGVLLMLFGVGPHKYERLVDFIMMGEIRTVEVLRKELKKIEKVLESEVKRFRQGK